MAMKLVDMAETPKQEAYNAPTVLSGIAAVPEKPKGPTYPYGLEITLNEETLKKLGISELPGVGEVLHAMTMMKITSVSESADESNHNCCVRAQIIQMGVENESREYSYKKTLYGEDEDD